MEQITVPTPDITLRSQPFIDFLALCKAGEYTLANPVVPNEIEGKRRTLYADFAPGSAEEKPEKVVKTCIEPAGVQLAKACRDESDLPRRPVPVSTICSNISSERSNRTLEAVRGLLSCFFKACG
jgi:hypothetical protein